MARNDGIDRTMARNRDLIADDIESTQAHNEREKEIYSNQDIVLEESHRNIHFKKPTASYTEMFDQLKKDGVISTRGQQADSIQYVISTLTTFILQLTSVLLQRERNMPILNLNIVSGLLQKANH